MLPTSAGGRTCDLLVSSRTSIQLSHRGQLQELYFEYYEIVRLGAYMGMCGN